MARFVWICLGGALGSGTRYLLAVGGISGFGAHSVLHTSHLLEASSDLPIVIEIVESPERVEELVRVRDEMVTEGLVTLEKVRVLKYTAGSRGAKGPRS